MTSEITDERILWEKRARYNPLLNITPQKLRTANDAFNIGYLSQAARIWEEVEEVDGIVATVCGKRRKRVSRLSWNIVPFGAADEKTARQHAAALEDFYNNILWSSACDKHRRGGLQGESAEMLEDDDCLLLEETLAAAVSSFVIRYYFGNVEPAAFLQFQRTDRSNKKAALEILGMTADRGVAVSQKAWREASGVAAPDEGEPCIEKSSMGAGVTDAFSANEDEIPSLRASSCKLSRRAQLLQRLFCLGT